MKDKKFTRLLCFPCALILVYLLGISFFMNGAATTTSTSTTISSAEPVQQRSPTVVENTDSLATHSLAQEVTFNKETKTHYIICSSFKDCDWIGKLINAGLPEALLTPSQCFITPINSLDDKAILAASQQKGNPVIIALGEYAPYVAQVTQALAADSTLKKIHSIIFINPTVTNNLQNPINIQYQAINYRVYNFFGRDFGLAWNYKILPCNKDIPLYKYQNNLFIKGVNLCCHYIDTNGYAQPFPFFAWGWGIRGNYPWRMSDEFIEASNMIIETLRWINANFHINTNLSCVLSSKYAGEPRSDVPICSALPFVHIYRNVDITSNGALHGIVTNKSAISKTFQPITSCLATACSSISSLWQSTSSSKPTTPALGEEQGALEFITDPLMKTELHDVYDQIKYECECNASTLLQAPYFQQFCLSNVAPSNIQSIINNPYKRTVARVRNSHSLCTEEKRYIATRKLQQVKPTIDTLFSVDTEYRMDIPGYKIPTIAIVTSGGGVRAMLATLGVLKGLEKIGLLDAVSYISALSGSTWAVGSWLSSGKSLDAICDDITLRLPSLTSAAIATKIASLRTCDQPSSVRQLFGQPFTYTDYYGSMLLSGLLGIDTCNTSSQIPCLSQQLNPYEQHATVPFPIYTAIVPSTKSGEPNLWYECTPYEIGQVYGSNPHYIPTWSLGRHFESGVSQTFAPEISFGTLMGTFGSAFGISLGQILERTHHTSVASACPQSLLDYRCSYAQFDNPARNMDLPQSNCSSLDLTDAGLDCNLPYPPISGLRSERKADIIIFVDASANVTAVSSPQGDESVTTGKNIQKIQNLFVQPNHDKGIALPDMPLEKNFLWGPQNRYTRSISIGDIPCSCFVDQEHPETPSVIYLPLVKSSALIDQHTNIMCAVSGDNHNVDFSSINMATYSTTNFGPTTEQARQLIALMEFNVCTHENDLKGCIWNWVLDSRKHTTMIPHQTDNNFTL